MQPNFQVKTGILSMQRIANYGSFLQAYALKRLLEEQGCDVEFVDYHSGKPLVKPDSNGKIARVFSKVTEALRIGAPLKETLKYLRYKKNYAKNYLSLLGLTEKPNYNPELDLLVIGSDEVFNCVQNNTNVGFSPELFGEGSRAKRTISFAASFGNTTVKKMADHGVSAQVTEYLKNNFDAISVRDNNSKEVIENLADKEVPVFLDPVLTYGFVNEIATIEKPLVEEPYLIVYGYSGRFTKAECEAIRKFAERNSLKILNVGGIQKCCDEFVDKDPFTVIQLFKHAKYVITDTFHGSILSIITHRPFAAFVRTEGYGNSEKLNDLLQRLDLTGRVSDMSSFSTVLITPIDYDAVDSVVESYREKANKFLNEEIRKAGEDDA